MTNTMLNKIISDAIVEGWRKLGQHGEMHPAIVVEIANAITAAQQSQPVVDGDTIERVEVAIAEELHLIPNSTPWEERSERLAKAAIDAIKKPSYAGTPEPIWGEPTSAIPCNKNDVVQKPSEGMLSEDVIDIEAKRLFDENKDSQAAPWEVQWIKTKQLWREQARANLAHKSQSPSASEKEFDRLFEERGEADAKAYEEIIAADKLIDELEEVLGSAETEMRYAGFTELEEDNVGRIDAYVAVLNAIESVSKYKAARGKNQIGEK